MFMRRLLLAVLAFAMLSLLVTQSPGYAAHQVHVAEETPTEEATTGPTDPATAIPTDPATPTTPPTLTPTATHSPTVPPTATMTPSIPPTNTALPTATIIPSPTAPPTAVPPTPIPQPTPAPLDGYLPLVFGWEPPPTSTPTPLPTQVPTGTPLPPPTQVPTGTPLPSALVNTGFEAGRTGWGEVSTTGHTLIRTTFPSASIKPHSGAWAAWLGGAYDETSRLDQRTTRPITEPYLAYWVWIASSDLCEYDVGGVLVDYGASEKDVVDSYWLCTRTSTGGWMKRVIDMRKYTGKTVTIYILAGTDSVLNSNMFVDDVTFQQHSTLNAAQIPDPEATKRLREAFRE